MENASRALIMAGSVLIAIIIIGSLILMFNSLSNYQDIKVQDTREAQVLEFNNQYETYNRKDVRGSDLYSLLNRVVDYNRRKSNIASGTDEGQNLKYKPMTVTVILGIEKKVRTLTYDGTIRLFKDYRKDGGKHVIQLDQETTNKFYQNINSKIDEIKNQISTSDEGLSKLAAGIDNLFGKETDEDKKQALKLWNRNVNDATRTSKYEELEKYEESIKTYYEYIQFKRAHFDCTGSKYDDETGRIIELDFQFNGKIE